MRSTIEVTDIHTKLETGMTIRNLTTEAIIMNETATSIKNTIGIDINRVIMITNQNKSIIKVDHTLIKLSRDVWKKKQSIRQNEQSGRQNDLASPLNLQYQHQNQVKIK